ALAALPNTDAGLRAVAWRARAAAAQVRCAGPDQDTARRMLDAYLTRLQAEQPDGGAIVREVAAIRAACDERLAASGTERSSRRSRLQR
ncbi:MAG: hypothetical protein ACREPE_12980, partial [Lysobacter sp.]